jgi:sulfopyruvate decarboxylase alpha subunit
MHEAGPATRRPRAGRHEASRAATWAHTLLEVLRAHEVHELVFLPDTATGPFVALAEADPFFRVTGVHREEEAVGILSGLYLGGRRGAMVVQSDGLGASLSGLASLALAYHIPFPIICALRGELGEYNAGHVPMGRGLAGCLTALGIQYVTIRRDDEARVLTDGALRTCYASEDPFAVLLSAQLSGWKPEQ